VRRIELKVRAADGRILSVLVVGPPEADPAFFLHGTPGVLGLPDRDVEEGARRSLRHVLYSRPGYGESDRLPGRSIADCAADVEAIADELGIGDFHVVGESGGASHALACAALLPSRVRAVAVLSGIAPPAAEGLDWEEGMGEGNRREFAAMWKGADVLRGFLEDEVRELRSIETKAQLLAALDGHLCDADRAVVEGGFGEYLLAAWRRIGEDGIEGWLDDDLAHGRDWGFGLEQVLSPVTVWHGREDTFVPWRHAEWLADRLPNAELHLLDGEGHISLVSHYGASLDALLALGR
jgi:pimeloyl-ACP methyl ester carboxylesterase